MKTLRKRILPVLVLTFCLTCILPGMSAYAEYVGTFPVDTPMYREFYQSNLPILTVQQMSGGLPAGVDLYWEDYKVYITGEPQNIGTFSAVFYVITSEGAVPIDVSLSVDDTPPATPTPTAAAQTRDIVITKNPSGERVEAGGSATFISKAENADRIVWRLVSHDASDTVRCSVASDYFPGLEVNGLGTDTLVLSKIPRDLNGWYVEAQFWIGDTVHRESGGALITIVDADGYPIDSRPTPTPAAQTRPTEPPSGGFDLPLDDGAKTANIVIQPQSWELKPGESQTLSVVATSPNNGTLSFQWYSAATDNRAAAVPISGASDASYTVDQADGTAYYWVAVWNSKDGSRSQAVYSEPAEVRIVTPSTPTPEPVVTAQPDPVPSPAQRSNGPNVAKLIPVVIIGALALAALIGIVIYMRVDARRDDEYDYDEDDGK